MGTNVIIWRAYVFTNVSRGAQGINAALYNSLALNFLANAVADECGSLFGGIIGASSIVSLYITTNLFIEMTLVPIFASRLDGTPHRFKIFCIFHFTWMFFVVIGALGNLTQISQPTSGGLVTYYVTLCVVSFSAEFSNALLGAYLPELVEGEEEITKITTEQGFLSSVMGVTLAVVVTIVGIIFGLNNIQLSIAGAFGVALFWIVWSVPGIQSLYKVESSLAVRKPRRNKSATGSRISPIADESDKSDESVSSSSSNLSTTTQPQQASLGMFENMRLLLSQHIDLGYFLCAFAFFIPAVANLIVLATSYLQNRIGLSGQEISTLSIIVVVTAAPSAFLTKIAQVKVGIKNTLVISVLLWTVSATLTPWTLKTEYVPIESGLNTTGIINATQCATESLQQATLRANAGFEIRPTSFSMGLIFFYAFTWGVGIGTVFSATTACYAVLVPGGKEATAMGMRTLAAKIVAWGPSLLYTVINEATGNLDLAMFSICFFLYAALLPLYKLDMRRGREAVMKTIGQRRQTVKFAPAAK